MKSVKSVKRPIAIDLFCGAGGMSVGIERAGFDIAFAVDYDGYHAATHERNFPYGKTICASVADLRGNDIYQAANLTDEVDLVFGGPPCQGFSNMGMRDTHDPRNSLIFHFARIVRELKARSFIMENVPGLNTGATIPIFEAFIEEMEVAYNIAKPIQTLNALHFGVPQDRKRLFILGVRKDIGKAPIYPAPLLFGQPPTVIEAIGDLPEIEDLEELYSIDIAEYDKEPHPDSAYARIARGESRIKNDYSRRRKWNKKEVSGCMKVRHSPHSTELYASTAPGTTVPGHKLPRLDPNGLCPTLRSGATSERGSHTAPRPIHPMKPRVITAREGARLHGYPDWFSFYPGKLHAARQIGNSVCPPVGHAAGLAIIEALHINPKQLPRDGVTLSNNFALPENRPKQHARIPVKVEFPKVINYIWEKAYDKNSRSFRFTLITPELIAEARDASGALLPRVRPERFLYEAGQQRGIRTILEVPLLHGYSIAVLDREKGIGQFQPATQDGSLGRPTAVVLRSEDVICATPISVNLMTLENDCDLLELSELEEVVKLLSNGAWTKINILRDLLGQPESLPSRAEISCRKGANRSAVIDIVDGANVPHARVQRLHDKFGVADAILLLRLTKSHFAVCACIQQNGSGIREKYRHVFKIAPRKNGVAIDAP